MFPIPTARPTDAATSDHGSAGQPIIVPGYFKMRSRFVDYTGQYVMHCHILAHEDRGMMTVVEVGSAHDRRTRTSSVAHWRPSDVAAACTARERHGAALRSAERIARSPLGLCRLRRRGAELRALSRAAGRRRAGDPGAILAAVAHRRARASSTSAPAPDGSAAPFVAANDDYVGVDLSRRDVARSSCGAPSRRHAPRLVQADGQLLPFGDATFDAVLLIQVFGGGARLAALVDEARRVLRPSGALVIGRTVAPADGVDARMKQQLASFLGEGGCAAA